MSKKDIVNQEDVKQENTGAEVTEGAENKEVTEGAENKEVNDGAKTTTAKETVSVTCPHCNQAFEIEIERPVHTGTVGRRGKLSGLSIEEMTDDQLKVELINSKSVLYKATKRGAAADVIAKNQERVDAAVAEKAKRDAKAAADKVATVAPTTPVDASAEKEIDPNAASAEEAKQEETVYNEKVENEI